MLQDTAEQDNSAGWGNSPALAQTHGILSENSIDPALEPDVLDWWVNLAEETSACGNWVFRQEGFLETSESRGLIEYPMYSAGSFELEAES